MEDFDEQASENFVNFFKEVSSMGGVRVIINGDFIDFPQVVLDSMSTPPQRFLGITEAESILRLQKVITGHPEEFEALKNFLSIEGNELLLIPGNHDVDFAWKRVLRTFMKRIGTTAKNFKVGMVYKEAGVYVTHGHQYSDENQIDVPINFTFNRLNSCWGTYFVEHFFNQIEEQHPLLDNARPMWKVALSAILHEELLVTAQFVAEFLIFLKNFRVPLKDFARSPVLGWKPKTRTRILRQRDVDALTSDIKIDVLREKIQELRDNPVFRRGFDAVFEELDNTQWEQVFASHGNTEQELLGFLQNTESRPRSRAFFSKPDNYQQAAEYIVQYHRGTRAIIMGHTHHGMDAQELRVKDKDETFLYFNTGTWTKMYNIPWWKLPSLQTLSNPEMYTPVFGVVRCTGAGDKLDVKYFENWQDAM